MTEQSQQAEQQTALQMIEAAARHLQSNGWPYAESMQLFQKAFVSEVLRQYEGNQSKAAPALGMHRNSLARLMKELHIEPVYQKGCIPPGLSKRRYLVRRQKRKTVARVDEMLALAGKTAVRA